MRLTVDADNCASLRGDGFADFEMSVCNRFAAYTCGRNTVFCTLSLTIGASSQKLDPSSDVSGIHSARVNRQDGGGIGRVIELWNDKGNVWKQFWFESVNQLRAL